MQSADCTRRVYLVGLYLVSALERVIYFASVDHPDAEP